jgi:hypothetical protein
MPNYRTSYSTGGRAHCPTGNRPASNLRRLALAGRRSRILCHLLAGFDILFSCVFTDFSIVRIRIEYRLGGTGHDQCNQ